MCKKCCQFVLRKLEVLVGGRPEIVQRSYGKGKSWDDLMALAHSKTLTGVILHDIAKWHGKGAVLADQLAILDTLGIPVVVTLMDYEEVNIPTLKVIADSQVLLSPSL